MTSTTHDRVDIFVKYLHNMQVGDTGTKVFQRGCVWGKVKENQKMDPSSQHQAIMKRKKKVGFCA